MSKTGWWVWRWELRCALSFCRWLRISGTRWPSLTSTGTGEEGAPQLHPVESPFLALTLKSWEGEDG